MKSILLALLGAASLAVAKEPPVAEKSAPPELRPRIYDVAGALGNQGFKARDGAWLGTMQGGKPQRLAVNLFAGNQYWFCAATSASGGKPSLFLRDPSGKAVETVLFEKDGVAAVGVTAAMTGRYVLQIEESAPGLRDFCVLYFFK